MLAELFNLSAGDTAVLAFSIVVVRELVSVLKESISYAKNKGGGDSQRLELQALQMQIMALNERLSRLEGQLDA